MRFSWVDVKLGARLVARFPFISAVGVLALALAIAIAIGGRLADGATFDAARAELCAAGFAAPVRNADARVQPRVSALVGRAPGEPVPIALLAGYAAVLLILAGAAANVATLVLARTALRESEIAVRSALGATRGRILGQILAEALVIAAAGAVAGLALAAAVIRAISWHSAQFASEAPPFWVNATIEPSTRGGAARLHCPDAACTGDRAHRGAQDVSGFGCYTSISW